MRTARSPQALQTSAGHLPFNFASSSFSRFVISSISAGACWIRFQLGIRSRVFMMSSMMPMVSHLIRRTFLLSRVANSIVRLGGRVRAAQIEILGIFRF